MSRRSPLISPGAANVARLMSARSSTGELYTPRVEHCIDALLERASTACMRRGVRPRVCPA
jgi:hypothetical protein